MSDIWFKDTIRRRLASEQELLDHIPDSEWKRGYMARRESDMAFFGLDEGEDRYELEYEYHQELARFPHSAEFEYYPMVATTR